MNATIISVAFGFCAPLVVAAVFTFIAVLLTGYFGWLHGVLRIADGEAWWGFGIFMCAAFASGLTAIRIFLM